MRYVVRTVRGFLCTLQYILQYGTFPAFMTWPTDSAGSGTESIPSSSSSYSFYNGPVNFVLEYLRVFRAFKQTDLSDAFQGMMYRILCSPFYLRTVQPVNTRVL